MTPKDDVLSAEITIAQLRTKIERVRNGALRQLGDQLLPATPLGHLKHLAQKSRDRIERVVARAEQSDARGQASEVHVNATLDRHDQFWDGVDGHADEVNEFTEDMQNQLGNEPKASATEANGSAKPLSDSGAK